MRINRYFLGSLKTRLIVMTLLFLLLPMGILGFLGYDYLYDNIKQTNIRAVEQVADAQYHHLVAMLLNNKQHTTNVLAYLQEQCTKVKKKELCFTSELQKFINNEQALGAKLYQSTTGKTLTVGHFIDRETLEFKDRQLAAFSSPNQTGERFYYVRAIDGQNGYQLLIMYSLQAMQDLVTVGTNLIGSSSDLFILDNQGFFITKPRLLTNKQLNDKENDHAIHHCLAASSGNMLDVDRRNVQIIHSFRFVPEIGGGCIMAHLDQAEAFAHLYVLQWRIAIITSLLVVVALAIALIVGRSITKPIDKLCRVTHEIINGNYAVSAVITGDTEIIALAKAFNLMAERLQQAFKALEQHRNQLEEQVAIRTEQLLSAKDQAEQSLNLLQQTQENLVQAEKMAALGGLVAGVAHEINTPLGITLTSASFLQGETEKIAALYTDGELDNDGLENYFDIAQQSSQLITINCQRAADLIQGFKQVAVDQTSEQQRKFNIKNYIEEVLLSLRPSIKKANIKIQLNCPTDLVINSYPGALSQIITNFIMNSLKHAYDEEQLSSGVLNINIEKLPNNHIELVYCDNGKGISPELQAKVFDPFFTTQRGNGGSGLGLHIVYNIVYQTLKGTLQMHSVEHQGTCFTVQFLP